MCRCKTCAQLVVKTKHTFLLITLYVILSAHLGIDMGEWLKEVEKRDSSAASFMASIWERDHKLYEEGLSSKVKRFCIKHLARR